MVRLETILPIDFTFSGGKKMPTKDTLIYIGTEDDGTRVYWSPYYCRTEYHKPDGKIDYVVRKF